ncbi:hypothetical protein [Yinghuangia seranimata]|uniref:hypothetical protein n=1 Tax=Yinghuangia seranimata TaxID=408067 RepID=UPI00248B7480|nr:hypothetical protein [Yinghuangia seranimata]MDI2130614.1 hypothetical protein [Yinghuangia seranimata]
MSPDDLRWGAELDGRATTSARGHAARAWTHARSTARRLVGRGASVADERTPYERYARLVAPAALLYNLTVPVVGVTRLTGVVPRTHLELAAAAMTVLLVLHVRHVLAALRGRRPRGAVWTLVLMAVVTAVPIPYLAGRWSMSMLAASCLLVLPLRWGAPAAAGVFAAQLLTGLRYGEWHWTVYIALSVVATTVSMTAIVWLARAVRRLHAARQDLARAAVLGERLRIDAELRHRIEPALAGLAADAARAARSAEHAPEAVAAEVGDLSARSRGTLAETRALLAGYQDSSLRAELATAATLFAAAGISVDLLVPVAEDGSAVGLTADQDAALRIALRETVARTLAVGAGRHFVVTLHGTALRVESTAEVVV